MNFLATLLLVVMGGLYWGTTAYPSLFPGSSWVGAFAEAALVGALADWFAVTALFRHPLGLPIPHTAIIPRNQGRIGEALGKFVQQNFLSSSVVERSFSLESLSSRLADWLVVDTHAERVASTVGEWSPRLLAALDRPSLSRFVGARVEQIVETTNVSRALGIALELVIRADTEQKFAAHLSKAAESLIDQHQKEIRELLMKEMPWYIPKFIHNRVYRSVVERMRRTLEAVNADPHHELRRQALELAQRAIQTLQDSPAYAEKVRALGRKIVNDQLFREYLSTLLALGVQRAGADLQADESVLRQGAADACRALGRALQQDRELQQQIDSWLKDTVGYFVDRHGDDVANLVSSTVKGWDTKTLVHKIESEIGRDLQFIRINGTIVGGLVGLTLHWLSSR